MHAHHNYRDPAPGLHTWPVVLWLARQWYDGGGDIRHPHSDNTNSCR